jgi:methylthioribose-1-phosphate isomerase
VPFLKMRFDTPRTGGGKVGSYPLAVLARYHHVPFIVVAPVTAVRAADAGHPEDLSSHSRAG